MLCGFLLGCLFVAAIWLLTNWSHREDENWKNNNEHLLLEDMPIDGHLFTYRHYPAVHCIYCNCTKDAYENLKSYGKNVKCNPTSKGH